MPRTINAGAGDHRPRSAASLRHQTFDSNCIDLRVRGNAWQVHEKYQSLARDAQGSGDRVAAENYLQHAEHYYRVIEAINEATGGDSQQNRLRAEGNGNAGSNGGDHRAPPTPVSYAQQPDMPTNYYGNNAPPPITTADGSAPQATTPAQAEVQRRTLPPNSFFTPDEAEEQHNGLEPLAVRR
jgi:hypothetical protein